MWIFSWDIDSTGKVVSHAIRYHQNASDIKNSRTYIDHGTRGRCQREGSAADPFPITARPIKDIYARIFTISGGVKAAYDT